MVNLRYLGTDTGLVIKTIAVEDIRKWTEIRDHLRWNDDQLKKITKALKKEGLLARAFLMYDTLCKVEPYSRHTDMGVHIH